MTNNEEFEKILENIDENGHGATGRTAETVLFYEKSPCHPETESRRTGTSADCVHGDLWLSDECEGQRKADRYSGDRSVM